MSNNTEVTFSEYLKFRHKLSEQEYDTEWIGLFVEKLYMNYHAAYMQGRADRMERVLWFQQG